MTTRKLYQYPQMDPGRTINSLVIAGTAKKGPVQQAFSLPSHLSPVGVLGDSPLAEAALMARRAGAEEIVLFRINGAVSESILYGDEQQPLMRFYAISGEEQMNKAQVTLFPTHLFIRGVEKADRVYSFDQFATTTSLAHRINQDAEYGLLEMHADVYIEDVPLKDLVDDPTALHFDGGSYGEESFPDREEERASSDMDSLVEDLNVSLFGHDEESQQEYGLDGALSALDAGLFLFAGMYSDDDDRIPHAISMFAKKKELYDTPCMCILSAQDPGTDEKKQELISAHDSFTGYGQYLQVVIGHQEVSDDHLVPLSYSYAGTQASLPFDSILTNKQMSGISRIYRPLNKEDVDLLSSNGYICIVPSIRRMHVAYRATTFASKSEPSLQRPHGIRISHYITQQLEVILDQFIGEATSFLRAEDIQRGSRQILQRYVDQAILKDFDISVSATENRQGIDIELSLMPYTEIFYVNTGVQISISGGMIYD